LNLRYRLIPYIYSEAWQITKNGSTIMRPLVLDFREDVTAIEQSFEYMFGKAFLVAPVIESDVNDWRVYLPGSFDWYNFWTGKHHIGGRTLLTEVPLDKIPLFVKAGSIIPMGPFIQYATEKIDPIEIRIYPGANGKFILYEDENDNYNYENGKYSTITFTWDDAKRELTISNRQGSFPGMLNERIFKIVKVSIKNGIGIDTVKKADKIVNYKGSKVIIVL
jgi:alpha-D-xyloside xylohydrolase